MTETASSLLASARPGPEFETPRPRLRPAATPSSHPRPNHVWGRGRWILRLAILAIAAGAPILAFAGERNVSVDIEGEVRSLRTYATNAADLLQRKGIETRRSDLVMPDTSLDEGDRVVYRRAKPIRLVLDGEPREVLARGLTVQEALHDLGLQPGPDDHVHPAPATELSPEMDLFVRNAVHAKLRVDGHLRDVVSSADTVENLLTHAGVSLGPDDYVVPAPDAEPADGMWIRVVRVRRLVEERNVRIPFRYVTERDREMESGVRKTVQQGSEGLKVQRFSIVLQDGKRVSATLLGENVVRTARDHIVRVGTREPTFTGRQGQSQEGLASWYRADGLVAAHRSLPMGSTVRVTNAENGKSVNVRIVDRGPWVDGRVIDLSPEAFERLAPLGAGTISVRVET